MGVATAMRLAIDMVVALTPLLGAIAAVLAALAAFSAKRQSALNTVKIQETHDVVNHRMDEFKEKLIEISQKAVANARLEGQAAGVAQERDRPPSLP